MVALSLRNGKQLQVPSELSYESYSLLFSLHLPLLGVLWKSVYAHLTNLTGLGMITGALASDALC